MPLTHRLADIKFMVNQAVDETNLAKSIEAFYNPVKQPWQKKLELNSKRS
jgi:hypothetical protein